MMFLQRNFSVDPSSLTRWRQRVGVFGLEKVLAATVRTAVKTGSAEPQDLTKVVADTTVMEKNIAYPTDSKLLFKAREKLVPLAKTHGIKLRQTCVRVVQTAYYKACRYVHAKQFRRMQEEVKKLKIYLGRTVRDIDRKTKASPDLAVYFAELFRVIEKTFVEAKNK